MGTTASTEVREISDTKSDATPVVESLAGRPALLTGAGGALGQHGVAALAARGAVPVGFGHASRIELDATHHRATADLIRDITYDAAIAESLRGQKLVAHCAALSDTATRERDSVRSVRTDIEGTLNVLRAPPETGGCRRFVYVSSVAVYRPSAGTRLLAEIVQSLPDPTGFTRVSRISDRSTICRRKAVG